MKKKAYNVAEASEEIGCCQQGTLNLIAAGELKAINVSIRRPEDGGRPSYRILAEDLGAFLAARSTVAASVEV